MKLKTNDKKPQAQKMNRVRVVFKQKETKMKVFKAKKNLKGSTDLWIGDDLTLLRNNTAYLARKAVKEKRAAQTWTFDGKIFLKVKEGEKPIRIITPEDIPN